LADLNRNDFLFGLLKRGFLFYLLLLFIMGAARVFFIFYYAPQGLLDSNQADLWKALTMGLRYDTMVGSYLLAPYVLLSIFVSIFRSRKLSNSLVSISSFFYFLATLLVIFFVGSDLAFYNYFQDRLNILFFGILEDDTKALATTLWKNYPVHYYLGAILGLFTGVWIVCKKIFKSFDRRRSFFQPGPLKFIFLSVVPVVLIFGGARGGYGDLVLSPKYADFSKSLFYNQSALNGILTFKNAYKLREKRSSSEYSLEKEMGYKKIHDAFSEYLGYDTSPTKEQYLVRLLQRRTPVNETIETARPHVVVFIMESFGANWIQYNTQNFDFLGPLKNHIEQDMYFKNFISSDNGTIGSLMTIGTNIPNRPGARFLSESRYMQTELESASHLPYKENGYETSFIYGGKLGWRGIGKFFKHQNYHHVEGESHIRESLNLKGRSGTEWGLYDEHLFNYVKKKLVEAKRPQFILALTTSNHPPFEMPANYIAPSKLEIPKELKSKIAREEGMFLKRFQAFQYSNVSLSNFLEDIKTGDLAQKTVVSFTGDHNFWGFINYDLKDAFAKYQVPFYIYAPKSITPKEYNKEKFGSHEDIFPTLYNLTLSDTSFLAFGEDLLSPSDSFALGTSVYAGKSGLVLGGQIYKWSEAPLVEGKSDVAVPVLNRVYRSSLSVSDFYLRHKFSESLSRSRHKIGHP